MIEIEVKCVCRWTFKHIHLYCALIWELDSW